MPKASFYSITYSSPISFLFLPYFFRLYIVRDVYGIDTEQIRDKCGRKEDRIGRKHAVTTLLIGVR
jgi:hypothetical protein